MWPILKHLSLVNSFSSFRFSLFSYSPTYLDQTILLQKRVDQSTFTRLRIAYHDSFAADSLRESAHRVLAGQFVMTPPITITEIKAKSRPRRHILCIKIPNN